MYKYFLACLFALLTLPSMAVGHLSDIQIYDRTDHRTLPVYFHEGRYYVVGRPGNEYQIMLRNTSGRRILAVTSVDGVNVITGDTASFDQSGYVLDSHHTMDIKGWRKNMQRTAAFYFTEHHNSYAARTGRPFDVGVIGVALFREKERVAVYKSQPYARSESAPSRRESASGSAADSGADRAAESAHPPLGAVKPESKLGTGHGRSESSSARYTDFERASHSPDEIITIHYNTYHNLVAQGVIRDYAYRQPHRPRPNPFPAGRFVPDP